MGSQTVKTQKDLKLLGDKSMLFYVLKEQSDNRVIPAVMLTAGAIDTPLGLNKNSMNHTT